MFLRIYSGILLSALLSLSSSYFAYQYIDQVRASRYTLNLFSGTLKLITNGVNRHSGEKQKQWVELVEKLIGLPIELMPPSEAPLTAGELHQLDKNKRLIQELGDHSSRIWTRASDELLVNVTLENVAEQQLRITAFLILNELGRFPEEDQRKQLAALQRNFSYHIEIDTQKRVDLDYHQQKRLNKGDVVVTLRKDAKGNDVLMVYSRYQKQRQYLVVGPIPIYDPTPTWLLAVLITYALSLTALITYVLVRRLEVRTDKIRHVVSNFALDSLDERVEDNVADEIGELAQGINLMADRIQGLLEDQKEVTQAISHELRTPIARMKFRVEVLKEYVNEDAQERLDRLNDDVQELDQLVEELMEFQMVESDYQMKKEKVDLAALVQEIKSEIHEPYQDIQFDLSIPDRHCEIYGDHHYLRRMLQNLLINALKHAKQQVHVVIHNPEIEQVSKTKTGFNLTAITNTAFNIPAITPAVIASYQDGNSHRHELTVEINDDGDGIPEEQRQRIFQAFVRLDSSRNRKTGGFGLGLAITSRIARAHHAQIEVGESILGGARFTICFPNIDLSDSSGGEA